MSQGQQTSRTVPSRWIWPFELLDKIGEGGMGVVYRARYVGNNRVVAVKLLPTEVAENPSLAARFDRELEILKQLRHPNIVHCFGGQCESKQRFYAMELVEGGTLAELLQEKGRLSWGQVIEYGLQMCAGLEHAHARSVVHRDVKPGNFLITKSGQLKLSDFGLATMASASRITRAGKTAGTFLYMAPEQIKGEPPVTNRTDLYALGCVLFELMTGQPPFNGESPAVILRKHLKEPPPRVATIVTDCPAGLDQLVSDLLEKDPEARPESAEVVAGRLKGVLRPSIVHIDPFAQTPHAPISIVASSSPSESDAEIATVTPRRSPMPWVVALCLVSLLAGYEWWLYSQATKRIAELEQAWVKTAVSGAPELRVLALDQLSRSGTLAKSTVAAVSPLLEDTNPAIRVAALKLLETQPESAGDRVALIKKMQQKDEDPRVRYQADITAKAIRDTPPTVGPGAWFGRLLMILFITALLWWAWNLRVWDRWLKV